MAGLEDINIDTLSLDQMDALSRGETAGLLPEVSPVSDPKPEPKPELVKEPVKDATKAEPAPTAKADDKKAAPAADDDDDEPAPADPNTATIPYQKYARERKQLRTLLKSLETKLTETQGASAKEQAEMRAKWERADERLKLLTEVMQPQQQEASAEDVDPKPDPAVDIVAYIAWQDREIARVKEGQQKTSETFQATQQEQALHARYSGDVAAYAQQNPEFWGPQGAYNGLLTIRAQTLHAQGYNEQQIRGILRKEEQSLVQRAYNERKNPAQVIHDMAKAMGWRAAAPAPAADPAPAAAAANGASNGNGHANGADAKPSVVEEVERIQRGMAGAKSLADVGGSTQDISLEALHSMSEKQFAEYYRKHAARVEALAGRRPS